jgi:hypothetical protein
MTADPPRPLTLIERLACEVARYTLRDGGGQARISWAIVRDLQQALERAGIDWRSVGR